MAFAAGAASADRAASAIIRSPAINDGIGAPQRVESSRVDQRIGWAEHEIAAGPHRTAEAFLSKPTRAGTKIDQNVAAKYGIERRLRQRIVHEIELSELHHVFEMGCRRACEHFSVSPCSKRQGNGAAGPRIRRGTRIRVPCRRVRRGPSSAPAREISEPKTSIRHGEWRLMPVSRRHRMAGGEQGIIGERRDRIGLLACRAADRPEAQEIGF